MKTPTAETRFYEFRFPHLNTMLRLVVHGESATIYASRDSFSMLRKELFIRELAAEGFIPDGQHSGYCDDADTLRGVRWLLDYEWPAREQNSEAGARRLARQLFISSSLLVAVFFGLVLGGSYVNSGSLPSPHQTALAHGSQMSRR